VLVFPGMNRVNERERKAIREFRRFARGVLQNYRALAGWVSRRSGISPTKALKRRKKIDEKARAIIEVSRLASKLPALQQELNDLIEERRLAPTRFFLAEHLCENDERKFHERQSS
jgi:hypothetical protein